MNDLTYRQKLDEEAALWGRVAEEQAAHQPPDWRYHRHLRHNVVMHGAAIDALLEHVQPGMRALELGCSSGWLTLALAQRGAEARGLDISDKALALARTYYESIKDSVPGRVEYEVADLNALDLPENTYDLVVAKSVLHHLVNLDSVIAQIHRTLKPGGLLWVLDASGDETLSTALVAGALTLVLPTELPYREKWRALRHFGLRSPERVKASIEAEGLSPFEGAGREHDWLALVYEQFEVERRVNDPAVTGYVSAQLTLPDRVAIPFLKGLKVVDTLLVRVGLLHNTHVLLYARKRA